MTTSADATRIVLPEPAALFTEAFLLGNGRVGATVYGRPGVEDIDLNVDTLWSGGPLGPVVGDRSAVVAELRAAIAELRHADADRLARELQSDGWTQSYQPLGRLRWRWSETDDGGDYERALDLAHAEAVTRSGGCTLSAFVSAPDGVVVAVTDSPADAALSFEGPHPSTVEERAEDGVRWLAAVGRAPARVLPEYVGADDPVTYADDEPADGTVPAGMGWALAAAVRPLPTGGSILLAAAVTGFRGWDQWPSADLPALRAAAEERVRAALARPIDELRARHRADYASFFDRVALDLGDSPGAVAAQRYFDLGRYLLISSSRPGTQAATLQGIWNVDVLPAWSSNYTTNINLPMNYWGAEVADLADVHGPLLDLTRELAAAGAATARAYYGARGAAAHHNTDLWRFSEPVRGSPQWANWPSGLTWAAAHHLARAAYGADDAAGSAALPVLAEVTAFLLDLLVDDGEGRLVASPSSSPENEFATPDGPCAVTYGATLDQELALEILGGFVALSDRRALADPLVDRARAALPRILRPRPLPDGRMREWAVDLGETEPGHRHLSHLYGVFPGTRITRRRAPADLDAARAALAYRLEHGSGYTGWSQAWVLCLAARLGDRDLAARSLDTLVHGLSSSSLLDLHPHGGWPGGSVFQIDGNLGAIAGIAELLLQSHDDAISLLPTLPDGWAAGAARGLRARGGHRVDLRWERGALAEAVIEAGPGGAVVVEADAAPALELRDARGELVPWSAGPDVDGTRARWTWRAEAGERYRVLPVR
ncbi:MAG: glycoside hydrolase N-terminal domain-containing protein [Arachnia sp.]